jgi:plastocyanin
VRTMVATVLAGVLAVACGGGQPTPAVTPGGNGAEVEIIDFGYQPASTDVATGATVTWTNTGSAPHTVTFNDGSVDSDTLQAEATFEHTFASAGTFEYHCTIHPQMRGTVTVGN